LNGMLRSWAAAAPVINGTIAPAQTSFRSIACSESFDRPRSAWQSSAILLDAIFDAAR